MKINKTIIISGIIAIIILGTIGLYFYKNMVEEDDYSDFEETETNEEIGIEAEDEIKEEIIVHITGCVKQQGIVILEEGERVIDAIKKAGGETEDADLNKINLAYEVQDGEKIYVPSKTDEAEEKYLAEEEKSNSLININKATKEQLQTLNGIGESMANKIIKYRKENGDFSSIEDIKNVPGIGNAKFENIKEFITVK